MKYPEEKGLQNDHFQARALSSSEVSQGLGELLTGAIVLVPGL